MIKAAIDRVLELATPREIEISGSRYTTSKVFPVLRQEPKTMHIANLDGLVDFLNDCEDPESSVVILINSWAQVCVMSNLVGDFDQRFVYVAASIPENKGFPFGAWMDIETFSIQLQSKFVPTISTSSLLRFISSIKDERVMQAKDDGVSQVVTARQGVSLVGEVKVPNPVMLQPYRTFYEIEQPESSYVFRARSGNALPELSLWDSDGGYWKYEAVKRIKAYFSEKLPGITVIG